MENNNVRRHNFGPTGYNGPERRISGPRNDNNSTGVDYSREGSGATASEYGDVEDGPSVSSDCKQGVIGAVREWWRDWIVPNPTEQLKTMSDTLEEISSKLDRKNAG